MYMYGIIIQRYKKNHTLQGTSQLLLHCTQSVERARSLLNAHLSGREKPSPQSVPWPSLFLLQLDFYHNTLQGTSQLCLHSQRARSLINADPSGREKPRLHIQFYARVVVELELRYVQRLPAVANYNCTVVVL